MGNLDVGAQFRVEVVTLTHYPEPYIAHGLRWRFPRDGSLELFSPLARYIACPRDPGVTNRWGDIWQTPVDSIPGSSCSRMKT
jgi:hypothetical protein